MRLISTIVFSLIAIGLLTGCSGWTNSKPPTVEDLNVPGKYAPPEMPTPRLRVAVAELSAPTVVGTASDLDIPTVGSDELWSLLDSSNRFDLTEHHRLGDLLANQKLSDMLVAGRLVHPALVKGFDYLLLTQVSQLSVIKEPPPDKVSVEGVKQLLHIDDSTPQNVIVDAKIELMLVDPRTGAVDISSPADFHRTATPQALNLHVSGVDLGSDQPLKLSDADTHQLIRLVLDNAVRSMLPRLDRFAAATSGHSVQLATTNPTTMPTNTTRLDNATLTASVICPECGAKVSADQEFCPVCGHKLR